MAHHVHPYSPGSNNYGHRVSDVPGMSVPQLYLAHILTGLASNPTTMLNIEEHLDYAIRMARVASEKAAAAGL